MTGQRNMASLLTDIALQLSDLGRLEDVCVALESGRLSSQSTGPVRSAISGGNPIIASRIRDLQELWLTDRHLSGMAMALALRTSAITADRLWEEFPEAQVVWTGPTVEGSYLRSTREVIRELLRGARDNIVVIGYWIAANDYGEGIIEELVTSLALAVKKGIRVTAIIDERQRPDGRDNRQALVDAWPSSVPLPRMFTWRLPRDDKYLKLHAKVLVADGADALVTSANLTYYAMDRNMEMGVRISGKWARSISDHFERLIKAGVIEEFSQQQGLEHE